MARSALGFCVGILLAVLPAAGCVTRHALLPRPGPHESLSVRSDLGSASSHNAIALGPPLVANSPNSAGIQQVSARQPDDESHPPWPAPLPDTVKSTSSVAGLGLTDAIEVGLTQNPDLITLRASEGVGEATLGVARTYPFNPSVQTRILPYTRFRNGNDGSVYNYVFVWQTFELAHQQRYRTQNAAAALNGIRWNLQQANIQNIAATTQFYFSAIYLRGLRDLARQTADLNDHVLEVTKKRFDAGGASAADFALARLDAQAAKQQAQLAEIALQNALLALRRHLNWSSDMPLAVSGELTDFTWQPLTSAELCKLMGDSGNLTRSTDATLLAAELAAARPDVLAARADMNAAQANVSLARASRVPNLQLGPFYNRDAASTLHLGFQAEMPVPVCNTGQPLVHQREAELHQRAVALEQLENKARLEARTALDRYEQARSTAIQMGGIGDVQIPKELEKLESQFRKGDIDILRITQARNSLIQLRRTSLDSFNELAQAAAALSAATGVPPAALLAPAVTR